MKRKFKKMISIVLCVLTLLSVFPAYASSIGSVATDPSIGEDTAQGAKTTYAEKGVGASDTDVYLTIDNSNVLVYIPTTIILNGEPTESGEFVGEYSVKVKGDMAGNEVLTVQPNNDSLNLYSSGKTKENATIIQDKVSFTSEDLKNETVTNGTVTATGLTAGTWSTSTVFNIYISNNISETNYVHNALLYSDNYLYSGARNAIVKYDVSENKPQETNVFNIETQPGQASYIITGLATKGDYIYVTSRQEMAGMSYNENNDTVGDLYILNKDDLSLVNKIDLGWKGSRVLIDGEIMIVNLQMKGYNIYKLDDLTNPTLLYSYKCNGDQEFQDGEIVHYNDKIYYISSGFAFGLYIFDITDTINTNGTTVPTRVGYMPFSWYKNTTPALNGLHIYDIEINSPYIYCSLSPSSTSWLNTDKDVRGILTVKIDDVITYSGGSKIPYTVTQIPEKYKICQGMSGDLQPTFMAYNNGYIFTSIGYRGIAVFSVKNDIPEFVTLLNTSNRNIRPVCIDKETNTLYGASGIGDQYKDILHFDISNYN